MAANSIHPNFVRIFYQDALKVHKMTIPVLATTGVVGGNYGLMPENGVPVPWGGQIDAFITLLRPIVNTATSYLYAELWEVDLPTGEETFLEIHDISLAGTASGTALSLNQILWSMRTNGGGTARLVVMGFAGAANSAFRPPNFGNAAYKAIADFAESPQSWFYGRDGTYISNVSRVLTKTNDSLRKRSILDQ
jgi:hypothetical protein